MPVFFSPDAMKKALRLRRAKGLVRKGLLSLRYDGMSVTWRKATKKIHFGSRYKHLAKQALFSAQAARTSVSARNQIQRYCTAVQYAGAFSAGDD